MTFASVKRILLVAAIVAVVVGSVFAVLSAAQTRTIGWFAYAPLSGQVFNPGGEQFVSVPTLIGLTIVALGLMAGAFLAGLVVGERRSRD
ncbi:hypothetical protein SAMN06295879_0437 [Agreia bicolorata]|uniref:Uncharacterized protein n=1 Tax=Agreia bicolorata TaxID=110935 RepID=A0A1T4WXS4_9MICO|nr:hypothetical protein [Agreia bicolorata]SKA82140.1 hypothetical protein SAMN06295879_0437 [Agreia bicolorata]